MIGVWLEDGRIRVREDLVEPTVPEGEALLRVRAAGICGTDLELLRGYRPFTGIPGHEIVGTVVSGPEDWVGARAVPEINITCASRGEASPCEACRAGRAAHCERRTVLGISGRDGGFAEYVAVPLANLHRIPAEISDEAAAFVEPLAAALRIPGQVELRESDRLLIVGFGRLGQLVARALARPDLALDVVSRSDRELGGLAATGARLLAPQSVPTRAYDVAIDCTGHPDGFGLARQALRPGGTLVVKSTYAGSLTVDASSWVVDEIRVVGSRCGPFPEAIRALAHGRVEVSDLVEARYPLSLAARAYEDAARPGAGKVLLVPDEEARAQALGSPTEERSRRRMSDLP